MWEIETFICSFQTLMVIVKLCLCILSRFNDFLNFYISFKTFLLRNIFTRLILKRDSYK